MHEACIHLDITPRSADAAFLTNGLRTSPGRFYLLKHFHVKVRQYMSLFPVLAEHSAVILRLYILATTNDFYFQNIGDNLFS